MKNNELEALKNLVASFADDKIGDSEVGGCSVGQCSTCCLKYNGMNA